MKYLKINIIIYILLIILVYDTLESPIKRNFFTSKIIYNKGLSLSKEKGKKLIVIGDPCVGNVFISIQNKFPNMKHGDITIDLFGCAKCLHMDINNIDSWKKFRSNGFVIIENGTLSFCQNNIQNVLAEIKRVSGGDFYSCGGTYSKYWQYFGYKQFSKLKNYPYPPGYMIYPFQSDKDKKYKCYNLKKSRYEYYDWQTLKSS